MNAGWDDEFLGLQLQGLNNADYNLALGGFDEEELVRLLGEPEAVPGLTDEDAFPALSPG